ncbi:hypothetical protein GCM10027190_01700 [Spirosoma areae]
MQQEIRPAPDQNTRACLIREKVDYSAPDGHNWQLVTQHFDYNSDGNPIRRSFINDKRIVTKTQTMVYDGLRLTRINLYEGKAETEASLTAYKRLESSPDFKVIVEHTFQRQPNNQYIEVKTRAHDFFRNENGALKLSKTELVSPAARPDSIGERLGIYWLLEYDDKNENVFRRWIKSPDLATEQVQYTQGGFDQNGRSHWNANLWLSFMRGFDTDFLNGDGYWSENNIAVQAGASGQALFFYNYELNSSGFPCVSYGKRADNVVDPSQSFYYYYNCDCQR